MNWRARPSGASHGILQLSSTLEQEKHFSGQYRPDGPGHKQGKEHLGTQGATDPLRTERLGNTASQGTATDQTNRAALACTGSTGGGGPDSLSRDWLPTLWHVTVTVTVTVTVVLKSGLPESGRQRSHWRMPLQPEAWVSVELCGLSRFSPQFDEIFSWEELNPILANKIQDFRNFVLRKYILIFDAERVYLKLQATNVKNKEVTANSKPQTLEKLVFRKP